jgi:hypothetical protein
MKWLNFNSGISSSDQEFRMGFKTCCISFEQSEKEGVQI